MEPFAPDRLRFLCPTRYHSFPNYFSNRGLLFLKRFPVRFDRAFTSYFSERSQPIDGVTSLAGCASFLPGCLPPVKDRLREGSFTNRWLVCRWPRLIRDNPRYTHRLAQAAAPMEQVFYRGLLFHQACQLTYSVSRNPSRRKNDNRKPSLRCPFLKNGNESDYFIVFLHI